MRQTLKRKLLSTDAFIDNIYLSKYITLIIDNKSTSKQYNKTQRHHILPKSYFEYINIPIDNSKDNLVNLLYKDHILAHYYLTKCTKGYLYYANAITIKNMLSIAKYTKCINMVMLEEIQRYYEKIHADTLVNKLDFNTLYDMYINKNKTREELCEYFNCDRTNIDRWLNRYGIYKTKRWESVQISKNELESYYIKENHTQEETAKHFNTHCSRIKKFIKVYNLHKGYSNERKNKKVKLNMVELKQLFIDKHFTIGELSKLYQCSTTTIKKYLRKYSIRKRV